MGTQGFGSLLAGNSSAVQTFTILNTGTADLTGLVVTSTNGAEFTVTAPLTAMLAPAATTFTAAFSPTAVNARSGVIEVASNDANENPFRISVAGNGLTATQVFTQAMTDAGLTGDAATATAAPQSDGVANLTKYAFNLNLAAPDVRVLKPTVGMVGLPYISPQGSGPAGVFRFEFLRRRNSGLFYFPQASADLTPLSWSLLTSAPTVTTIDATWERVVHEEPYDPITTPRLFGRVEVSLP